ncbi:quinone oxidoreductase family protein [Streptomyces sp. 900105755]|uniref:quinone oxidoreductase family protein n=1 Tax=Streptomyces sp. 900105755 TaxID=3154389 RepID=UPI0033237129
MKAAVLHTFGEAPRYESFADPVPGEGEVTVTVTAAALNHYDRNVASGKHYESGSPDSLPRIPGAVGVGRLADGTRVSFTGVRAPFGAMAEQAVVPQQLCIPLPDQVSDETAAALFNPAISQWMALDWRAGFQRGESILVLGATGVTGRLAVQIARLLGAGHVVGAGREEASLEAVRALGADAIVRLSGDKETDAAALWEASGKTGYDVVLDYVWGPVAETALAMPGRASRTRYLQIGAMAGAEIRLSAQVLRAGGWELMGSGSGTMPPMEQLLGYARSVLTHAATGRLTIDVEIHPLADVESVWPSTPRARVVFRP